MSFVLPETDTVYVTGLPGSITEADVAEFFGTIGVIKFDKQKKKHKVW